MTNHFAHQNRSAKIHLMYFCIRKKEKKNIRTRCVRMHSPYSCACAGATTFPRNHLPCFDRFIFIHFQIIAHRTEIILQTSKNSVKYSSCVSLFILFMRNLLCVRNYKINKVIGVTFLSRCVYMRSDDITWILIASRLITN